VQSIEATEVRLKAKENELMVLEVDLRGRAIAAQKDVEESERRLAEAEDVVRRGGADIDRRGADVDALKANLERQEQVCLTLFISVPIGVTSPKEINSSFKGYWESIGLVFSGHHAQINSLCCGFFPSLNPIFQEVKRRA
jgi:hypothetical protein